MKENIILPFFVELAKWWNFGKFQNERSKKWKTKRAGVNLNMWSGSVSRVLEENRRAEASCKIEGHNYKSHRKLRVEVAERACSKKYNSLENWFYNFLSGEISFYVRSIEEFLTSCLTYWHFLFLVRLLLATFLLDKELPSYFFLAVFSSYFFLFKIAIISSSNLFQILFNVL